MLLNNQTSLLITINIFMIVLRIRHTIFLCHLFTSQVPVIVRTQIRGHGNLNLSPQKTPLSAAGSFLTVRCLQRDLIKARQKMIYCLQEYPDFKLKKLTSHIDLIARHHSDVVKTAVHVSVNSHIHDSGFPQRHASQ